MTRMVRLMVGRSLSKSTNSRPSPKAMRFAVSGPADAAITPARNFVRDWRGGDIRLRRAGRRGPLGSRAGHFRRGCPPGRNADAGRAGDHIRSPRDAIRQGIFLAPEDRRRSGLIVDMTIRDNITLPP